MGYKDGTSFGELALMYNAPRAATVIAKEDSRCFALDRMTFKKILFNQTQSTRSFQVRCLDRFEMFDTMSRMEKLLLTEALEVRRYQAGDRIIQQGDLGTEFFMIDEGECKCVVGEAGRESECFRRLGQGDFFGELALLHSKPRAVSVDAVVDCKLHVLKQVDFERLMGPVADIL